MALLKDLFCQLPHFRVPVSFLFFGIEGGGSNSEEIFADGFNAVLAALIIPQRLPMHGHGIQEWPAQAAGWRVRRKPAGL